MPGKHAWARCSKRPCRRKWLSTTRPMLGDAGGDRWKSLGVPEEWRMRRLRAGTFERKNRQFLANPVETGYCFPEIPSERLALLHPPRREGLGVRSDSLMALQAIGIAQNGLANSSRL